MVQRTSRKTMLSKFNERLLVQAHDVDTPKGCDDVRNTLGLGEHPLASRVNTGPPTFADWADGGDGVALVTGLDAMVRADDGGQRQLAEPRKAEILRIDGDVDGGPLEPPGKSGEWRELLILVTNSTMLSVAGVMFPSDPTPRVTDLSPTTVHKRS